MVDKSGSRKVGVCVWAPALPELMLWLQQTMSTWQMNQWLQRNSGSRYKTLQILPHDFYSCHVISRDSSRWRDLFLYSWNILSNKTARGDKQDFRAPFVALGNNMKYVIITLRDYTATVRLYRHSCSGGRSTQVKEYKYSVKGKSYLSRTSKCMHYPKRIFSKNYSTGL